MKKFITTCAFLCAAIFVAAVPSNAVSAVNPAPPAGTKPSLPIVITTLAPNVLLFDASAGHHVLTIPQQPRQFASMDDFLAFCLTTFHGRAVRDAHGKLVAVTGSAVIRGHAVSVDPTTHQIVEHTDPVVAQLAGLSKKVRIGTQTYDLSAPVQSRRTPASRRVVPIQLANFPGEVDQCNAGACTKSTSFITSLVIYESAGSTTQQTSGGFQQSSVFCWKDGFIPWVCTKSSGSNSFFITNQYFNFAAPIAVGPSTATQSNVTSLTLEVWAFGTALGIVGDVTGVCGAHTGTGVAPSGARTSSGKLGTCRV
jgi:hypothetical protein